MPILEAAGAASLQVPADSWARANCFVYGNSIPVVPRSWGVVERYVERIARRAGGNLFNSAVGGLLAHDVASYAYGSIALPNPTGANTAGTWTVATTTAGVMVLDLPRNDAGYDAVQSTAKARAGFTNALNALVRLVRAGTWVQDSAGGFVYTGGGWASNPAGQTLYKGNSNHATGGVGNSVTWTTPVGTDFDLVLVGIDSSSLAAAGTPYTWTIDGVPQTAGTTNDTFAGTKSSATLGDSVISQYLLGAHGLASAAHTITVTQAGVANNLLIVNGGLQDSPNPPTCVVMKCYQLSAAGYAAYGAGASWATDQIYNALIDTYCAQFADQSVVSVNPAAFGWDPTKHLLADGIHPNEAGMLLLANAVASTLNALPPRLGLTNILAS